MDVLRGPALRAALTRAFGCVLLLFWLLPVMGAVNFAAGERDDGVSAAWELNTESAVLLILVALSGAGAAWMAFLPRRLARLVVPATAIAMVVSLAIVIDWGA